MKTSVNVANVSENPSTVQAHLPGCWDWSWFPVECMLDGKLKFNTAECIQWPSSECRFE